MLLPLHSNRGTALLLMQAAQSAQRITLLVLPLEPMQTHPLPTRPLLMQQLLDSRRVQPLALNRGTTVQRMRWSHLLLPNTLSVSLLLTKMLPPHFHLNQL